MRLDPGAYGLIGPNAAGKTTLLRKMHAEEDASIAPSPGDASFAGITVSDHLACAHLARGGFDDALADRILGDVPRKKRFSALSAGERRLLTLTSALASDAPILLLDEPLDGLDVATRERLRRVFIELLSDGEHTLVIATHRAEDLVGLVERVITVHDTGVSEPIDLDTARADFPTLTGHADVVDELAAGKRIVDKRTLGHVTAVTLAQPLNPSEVARSRAENIEVSAADDATLINLLAANERN